MQSDFGRRRRAYLLQEPYDDDAVRFIEAVFRATGLRPVCWYRDRKARFYGERDWPLIASPIVEASVDVDGTLERFAQQISTEYEIVAAIPFREDTVESVATMLPYLPDVDWMDAARLARFRDKHALKTFLARDHPEIRVPASRAVRSIEDVLSPEPPERFVLKPNDGMGSESLGFFRADDEAGARRHLESRPGIDWIMEEFIDGPEFRINGQVRRDGTVQTLICTRYVPQQITDTFTLAYASDHSIHTTDPEWDRCVGYAESIIAATGLRGSPFHIEVRIDEQGPAMVDFGARVPSEATGLVLSWLHPDRPDFYSVAARDYLADNDFATGPLDYTAHDSVRVVGICGVSDQDGVVVGIDGLDEVEAMPEFVFWQVRPHLGQVIRRTDELRGTPYILTLRHDGDIERGLELDRKVREAITLTVSDATDGLSTRLRHNTLPRIARKADWLQSSGRERIRLRSHTSGQPLPPK